MSFMHSIIRSSTPRRAAVQAAGAGEHRRARSSSPEASSAMPRCVRVVGDGPSSLDRERKSTALSNSLRL